MQARHWGWLLGSLVLACGATKKSPGEAAGGEANAGSQNGTAGKSTAGGGGKGTAGDGNAAGKLSSAGGDAAGGEPSDSEGPSAQGAAIFSIAPVSPPVPGKACPSNPFTAEIPAVASVLEKLTASNYLHHVVDGEEGVAISCSVVGDGSFVFSGSISQNGRSLKLSEGSVEADGAGTVTVTLSDASHLSGSLSGQSCTVTAKPSAGTNFQIKAGSMWASFNCPAVEAPPTSHCQSEGIFVLENCEGL